MKTFIKLPLLLIFILFVALASCSKDGSSDYAATTDFASRASGSSAPSSSGGQGNQNQPGVITAGEWNDLMHWAFWDSIVKAEKFQKIPSQWNFYNTNRISLRVTGSDNAPIVDAPVKLKRGGNVLFSARTDNQGYAEVYTDPYQGSTSLDYSMLRIDINNGQYVVSNVKPYSEGLNRITVSPKSKSNRIEIAFAVDATGSMGDELEYLKTELLDVINRVKSDQPNSVLYTSSVFYRDEGDDYVTKVSNFSSNINTTLDFIKKQSAAGGGDIPEAVHTAIDKSVNELQWSSGARTRILFLLLDAPPHHEDKVIGSLQNSIIKAAEKGIRIIPITASGIDKQTEYLMRSFAILTNGTYVFITNHSGIGNDHLQATVGDYKVEYLNDLMVRLINKFAE
jgi:hypothetical protein